MPYDRVYYHDYHGWRDTKEDVTRGFQCFYGGRRVKHLRQLVFYTATDDVNYTVIIYDRFEGGELLDPVHTQSGHIDYRGFHTIEVSAEVSISQGNDFYVYVSLDDGGHPYDCTSDIPVLLGADYRTIVQSNGQPGQSFYREGGDWVDLFTYNPSANFCIKALTNVVCWIESSAAFGPAPLDVTLTGNAGTIGDLLGVGFRRWG